MHENQKLPVSLKKRNGLELTPGALHLRDTAEAAEAHNTPEPKETTNFLHTHVSQEVKHAPEPAGASETVEELKTLETLETVVSHEEPHAIEMQHVTDTLHAPGNSDSPSLFESLKMPLMAIIAAASLLVGWWGYSSSADVRAQLEKVTTAKASVDRTLAETLGKLAATEKAIADVKAALTTAPAAVPAKK